MTAIPVIPFSLNRPKKAGSWSPAPPCPGVVTEGDTLEEARAMAEDAIRGYIESLSRDHLPIPSDKAPVKEEIRVMVPERA